MILLDLFVSQNKLTEEEAKEMTDALTENELLIVDELLLKKNITSDEILQVRSVLYGLPIYKEEIKKDVKLTKILSTQQSKQMLAIPIDVKDEVLYVGVLDPDKANVLESLQFLFSGEGRLYKIYLISFETLKGFLGDAIGAGEQGSLTEKVDGEGGEGVDYLTEEDKMNKPEGDDIDLTDIDAVLDDDLAKLTVPQIISTVLRYAIDHGASDIHIEHMGTFVRVRCRIDGTLEVSTTLPVKIHIMLIARIKILCSMKLDEKRKPQDGRFSTRIADHTVDYRVSTFPGYYGEKVVIRILDSSVGVRQLDTVGLSPTHMKQIRDALAAPYGIVLISGPTGSGKTTTLYSMLNELDRDHRNAVSLEDPVEYNVPSMNQSQVFPDIGYTFASGLRSILRQDPDIIMVGEIRDGETAKLAIQAALTGHLVFSTIHTNTSVGVITRLLDMGVEPYLIAPVLNLTIGQRLVRGIAPGCAKAIPMDSGMQTMINEQFKELPDKFKSSLPLTKPFNEVQGNAQYPSGMLGRVPVFEVLTIDTKIEALINKSASEEEIWSAARENGMMTIKEDAMIKSIEGKVPFAEIHEL